VPSAAECRAKKTWRWTTTTLQEVFVDCCATTVTLCWGHLKIRELHLCSIFVDTAVVLLLVWRRNMLPYDVTLESRPDGQVKVLVRSQVRPGLLATLTVPCDRKKAVMAAAACAFHILCKYQDSVDPDRMARIVEQRWGEFVAAMERERPRELLVE